MKSSQSLRVGLSLGGGGVRGIAHIGVIKELTRRNIRPSVIAGTSVGSLIGVALSSGLEWDDIADVARSVNWLTLLNGRKLESFCEKHFPEGFQTLKLPFIAAATVLPSKKPVYLETGNIASAISASCALRPWRLPVRRGGLKLADGGIACVLPSVACRALGADFVIASDVWEGSALLRALGCRPHVPHCKFLYPEHFRQALEATDLYIQPSIPFYGYIPRADAVDKMIAAGERAAQEALGHFCRRHPRWCGRLMGIS